MSKLVTLGFNKNRWLSFGGLILVVSLLSSCGGGRAELGPKVTRCYQILPVAQKSIAQRTSFVGVRLISAKRVETMMSVTVPPSEKSLCLVAYKIHGSTGTFIGSAAHHYVLVAVSSVNKKIYGTVVAKRLPMDFRHDLPFS